MTGSDFADGGYVLTLKVANEFGAIRYYSGVAEFSLDTTAPDLPLSIEIINGRDDLLDSAELAATVTVRVSISATADVGDVLEIDVNGNGVADSTHIVTAQDIGCSVDVPVPGASFLVNTTDNTVTATLVDSLGNKSAGVDDSSTVLLTCDIDPIKSVITDQDIHQPYRALPVLVMAVIKLPGQRKYRLQVLQVLLFIPQNLLPNNMMPMGMRKVGRISSSNNQVIQTREKMSI